MPDSGPDGNRDKIPFFTNLIATGLFAGYVPWASGTFGTIVGILISLLPGMNEPRIMIPVIVAGFFTGVVTSGRVARIVGHRLSRSAALAKATFQPDGHEVADPSIVVIDEIVGIWITLLFLPGGPIPVVIAFLSFRAFDIIKPPPARQLERVPHGWGIMLDDVVAGIYANIATRVLLLIISPLVPTILSHG